jgi:hypothetical protein
MNTNMARPKKIEKLVSYASTALEVSENKIIHPLLQEFGNGDLNILRDKINEIIKER